MPRVLFVIMMLSCSAMLIGQNVGIGTIAPDASAKLDINADNAGLLIPRINLTAATDATTIPSPVDGLIVWNTGTGGLSPAGFYYWEAGTWTRLAKETEVGDHDWYVENTTTSATSINQNIYTQGAVTIGNTASISPAIRLDVNGNINMSGGANTFIYFNNYDNQHYIGYSGGTVVNAENTIILDTGLYGEAGSLNLKSGRVGIGTYNPSRGKLHVEGYGNANTLDPSDGNFTFYALDQYTGTPGNPYSCCNADIDISIWASNRVVASEFNAKSDARIKNILGFSNNKADLKTLLGIRITDYTLIDPKAGHKEYKKVIAQQIKEIFPQAVSEMTGVIPDIFRMAKLSDGHIALENDLKKGEKIRLIFPDSEALAEVMTADENGFQVDIEGDKEVFVYGREVDDFQVVDYEAIAMLNVSASQELHKEAEKLKAQVSDLEAKLDILTAALESQGIQVNGTAKK